MKSDAMLLIEVEFDGCWCEDRCPWNRWGCELTKSMRQGESGVLESDLTDEDTGKRIIKLNISEDMFYSRVRSKWCIEVFGMQKQEVDTPALLANTTRCEGCGAWLGETNTEARYPNWCKTCFARNTQAFRDALVEMHDIKPLEDWMLG